MDRETIQSSYLTPLMKMKALEDSVYHEEKRERPDGPFQRDYSRIMYASSFRRLQGKMQLLGIKQDQFFRNRLTHSLEVAQIARSLAAKIGYSAADIYVVEAGALAHDIGNPPFGHAGERTLHELFSHIGGFEGNAQTLRLLTTVEKKKPDFRGLNLTYRTLFSVVKYFKKFDPKETVNQKFIYDDDYKFLNKFISEHDLKVRTLDVQIVDIADEIAYAAHDLEDGLRQKCFSIDEILHEYRNKYQQSESYELLQNIVDESRAASGFGTGKIYATQYSKMFRQELTSRIVHALIEDVDLMPLNEKRSSKFGSTNDAELQFVRYGELAEGLKVITFECINHNHEVYMYEEKGDRILRYLAARYQESEKLLPPEYRAKNVIEQYQLTDFGTVEDLRDRLICDYIAGMMDSYALSTYEKLKGSGWYE